MKPKRRRPVQEPTKAGPRARDADRDQAVEALLEAYVDGQLDADERERRTALALSATHLVDLEPLTADLQVPAKAAVPSTAGTPQSTPVRRPAPKTARSSERDGWPLGAEVGLGVAVVSLLIGGVGTATNGFGVFGGADVTGNTGIFGGTDDNRYASLSGQPTTPWSEVADDLPAPTKHDRPVRVPDLTTWSVTRENVQALLRGYREQLGTPYFRRMLLYPEWASIDRPVSGDRPTLESWTFDQTGEFTLSEVNPDDGEMPLMDVGDLDVDGLFASIEDAFDKLDSDDPRLLYVTVDLTKGNPAVDIFVADKYDISISGYVTTTLSGKLHRGSFVS